jgi:hypothetical protein
MIDAETLSQQLGEFLEAETSVEQVDGRVAVLTPAEYPNRDGVVVWVEPAEGGGYVVSDHGEADSTLVPAVGRRAVTAPAVLIATRFGVTFEKGQVRTNADEASLAEACWRVAQAAAALAEQITFYRAQPQRDVEFVDLLASELRVRNVEIEREPQLEGASGHRHRPSIYLPRTETVIEPVGGDRPWQVASAVYVEFGDLKNADGYRLIAVLDDREANPGEDVAALLRQVAGVSRWSQSSEWMSGLTAAD